MKYTITDLWADYPDDAACLRTIVDMAYPDGITCKKCDKVTKHYPVAGRKAYACANCGTHMYPMKGTIFEGTKIPLQHWFYAMYLMATNKAGTSAAQLQRELGCKWDTAHRMQMQIRKLMEPSEKLLQGNVEMDETFIHANTFKRSSALRRYGRDPRRQGQVVFGMLQRGGEVKVWHISGANVTTMMPLINKYVPKETTVHTDGFMVYRSHMHRHGYTDHRWTDHGKHQYYTPESSTQGIENFWSTWKPRMKGVYKTVSGTYLQQYANEYAWRYSNRGKPSMFWSLVSRIKEI